MAQADIDDGVKPGVASAAVAEVQRLEQELRERNHEKSGEFLRGGVRLPTQNVVVFVDANKDDIVEDRKLGVELICTVLQVAPSTYYAARDRAPSARTLIDAVIGAELFYLWVKTEKAMGFANSGRRQDAQALISGVIRQPG